MCVRAHVRVCVRVCDSVCAGVCMHACSCTCISLFIYDNLIVSTSISFISSSLCCRQRDQGRLTSKKERKRLHHDLRKLRQSLEKEKQKTNKYKKRYFRLKNKTTSPSSKVKHQLNTAAVQSQARKTLKFHSALLRDIKSKYTTSYDERERQIISKLVSGQIVKKYRMQKYGQSAIGLPRRRWKTLDGNTLSFSRKEKLRIPTHVKSSIRAFYDWDDVSRVTTGRKQTITRNKVKKQKRFLVDTLLNLHRKFLSENANRALSYTLFCRLRPFWVVHPTIQDRDTCMCKIHENLSFVVDKLKQLNLLPNSNLEKLIEEVSCSTSSKECMYGECPKCKLKSFPLDTVTHASMRITYTQWVLEEKEKNRMPQENEAVSFKVTAKKLIESSLEELIEHFTCLLHKFKKHVFNIKQQFSFSRELKRSLSSHECIINVDFSENYSCKYSAEIQAVHFGASHQQATMHTGVLYVGDNSSPLCFCTISQSKKKGPPAIWQHLEPVLDYIQAHHPSVSVVHFFSDGPCTQYRQKGNFFLFSTELSKRGFQSGTWNFFEASHGKGAPDGVGGVLKRLADQLVSQGRDIPDAITLYRALLTTGTTVKLFYVEYCGCIP